MAECLRTQIRNAGAVEDSRIFGREVFEDLWDDTVTLGCEVEGCSAELVVARDQAYQEPNSGLYDPWASDLTTLYLRCAEQEG